MNHKPLYQSFDRGMKSGKLYDIPHIEDLNGVWASWLFSDIL